MKNKKARQLTEHLDEAYILMAANPEAVFKKKRHGVFMKRFLLVAACVAMLTVIVMSVLLPAMLSDPEVTTNPSDTEAPPLTDVEWVEDSSIVRVQRLSAGKSLDAEIVTTTNNDSVTVDTERCLGQRLILLSFHCREGERITVTPSADGALFEAVQIEINQGLYWSVWNEQAEEYRIAGEYLKVNTAETLACLGQSVVLTKDTVLLWQYPDISRPCTEDNFVDFTVTDTEGRIKGGGSIYIGGLDLTTISENKTYYGRGHGVVSYVYLNASYRPVLLGAYRYTEGSKVDADVHAVKLAALHDKASNAREGLFDDLSEDYFRLSYRVLLFKYGVDDSSIFTGIIHRGVSYDRYAYVVTGKDVKRFFFLYDGTCQPITEWETYTADEYGYTVKGKLTLEDGTVVMVDINNPDCMYEILPPTE